MPGLQESDRRIDLASSGASPPVSLPAMAASIERAVAALRHRLLRATGGAQHAREPIVHARLSGFLSASLARDRLAELSDRPIVIPLHPTRASRLKCADGSAGAMRRLRARAQRLCRIGRLLIEQQGRVIGARQPRVRIASR
jgi:hypothetical protein